MNRREFLTLCGAAAGGAALPQPEWAAGLPKDIRITRVIGFDLVSRRSKFCGKNSRLDDHGDQGRDRMVRLFTNAGIEGFGNCRAGEAALSSLLGHNAFDFFKRNEPAMRSPLGAGTMPLWDLAGKALEKPVYKLLGGKGPRRVPVYDGSIYFSDLLAQDANRWQDRFKEEIDLGFKRGHRAFKIKIGRGAKWMPANEGYARDKEVLQLIRRHAGPSIVLGADANDGYNPDLVKRLISDLPDIQLAFLEEMFPENVDQYLELKAFLRKHGLNALIADGETQPKIEGLKPFIEARAIDVYQADMNRFGFEGILQEAASVGPHGFIGPHNWGSLIGFYMILHLGKAIKNFYYAENDPLDTDVMITEGYAIKDGTAVVPDTPGFGLKVDEKKFASTIKPQFDLRL
jgi:D-galactarolactone cycloisomerase